MSDPTNLRQLWRQKTLAPLLAGCLLLAAVLLVFSPNYRWDAHKGDSPYGSDFLQEWTAASMIGAGHASELYSPAAFAAWQHDPQRVGFEWNDDSYYPAVYPPAYYWLCSPLQWIDYRWAVCLWLGLSMAALLAAAAVIQRAVRMGNGPETNFFCSRSRQTLDFCSRSRQTLDAKQLATNSSRSRSRQTLDAKQPATNSSRSRSRQTLDAAWPIQSLATSATPARDNYPEPPAKPPAITAWFWPAMLLFPPLLLGLTMGQKGPIWLLLWSVTWLLMRGGRPLVAGLAFGLLSIKPTLFFLLPLVMLRHGQWRFVAGASLSWAALWGAAASVLPSNVWTDFLAVARSAGDYHQHAGYQLTWSSNLQSLVAGLPQWVPGWISALLWMIPAGYVLWRIAAQSQFRLQNSRDLCQVLLATCLLSPHLYAYDLVVLLLPICGMWHTHRREAVVILAGLWLGMLASQPCLSTIGLPLMPVVLLTQFYWLSTVRPGQSSVRKGVSGRPAPSYILQTGLSAQA